MRHDKRAKWIVADSGGRVVSRSWQEYRGTCVDIHFTYESALSALKEVPCNGLPAAIYRLGNPIAVISKEITLKEAPDGQ